ncbi:hypothetical protein EDB92DRAFT_1776485, partial [Lactarius akahatsu]
DNNPRIAMETLQSPIKEGGLKILNVKARNKVIEIMWRRTYLNFTPSRPIWTAITDLTLAVATPPRTSSIAIMNCFLQSWNPPSQGPRVIKLACDIMRMLKMAKKYNTCLAAIRHSQDVCSQLPAWYHL